MPALFWAAPCATWNSGTASNNEPIAYDDHAAFFVAFFCGSGFGGAGMNVPKSTVNVHATGPPHFALPDA
ncbi:MAG TPA: hypothetical protein PKE47_07155, partial [Verrucomicrobiota bacterium]|nr:hypothetical protein [Verrucomicrobiota bacterium]